MKQFIIAFLMVFCFVTAILIMLMSIGSRADRIVTYHDPDFGITCIWVDSIWPGKDYTPAGCYTGDIYGPDNVLDEAATAKYQGN
jgi:hypothetical protein